jgi:uncharacterized GH25 family protein
MLAPVPITRLPLLVRAAALAALLASTAVQAHDTWLQVAPQQPGAGLLALQLGSGGRYPKSDGVISSARVVRSGCIDEAGQQHGLSPRSELPLALEMRSRIGGAKAVGCWLELLPVELTLAPDLVQAYVEDVRAPQAVRDAWARQAKAGVGWNEVYRKYVRIEAIVPGAAVQDLARARLPHGDALELLPVGSQPLRAAQPIAFQALSNGKPVAGLAIELVPLRGAAGIWAHTDAQGRISVQLPAPGEWLLRSTAFDPLGADNVWRTRFATLTVQVQ